MRKHCFVVFIVFGVLVSLGSSLRAAEKSIRVRDAGGRCGLYVRGLVGPKANHFVAEATQEAIETYFASDSFQRFLARNLKEGHSQKPEVVLLGLSKAESDRLASVLENSLKARGVFDQVQTSILKNGIYVSDPKSPSRGEWVGGLDDLESVLRTRADLGGKIIYGVGLSLFGKDRAQFVDQARGLLLEQKMGRVGVRPITAPANLFESLVMFMPLPEDWQKPTLGELIPGVSLYLLSNTTFAVVTALTQPAEIAVPVTVVNALQSAMMTFPRQFWGNYFARSRNFPEKITKQIALTGIFTMGISLAKVGGERGVAAAVSLILSVWQMGALLWDRIASVLFQTGWRLPVEGGIPQWVAEETRRGREQRARKFGTWYRQIATNIATPAWAYSTITKDSLGHFLMDWTVGHIIMAGVGVFFTVANHKPIIYQFPLDVADRIQRIRSRTSSSTLEDDGAGSKATKIENENSEIPQIQMRSAM